MNWKCLGAAVNIGGNITHLSSMMEVSFASGGFSHASMMTNDAEPLKNFPRARFSHTTRERHCRIVAEHAYPPLPAVRFERGAHAVPLTWNVTQIVS